MWRKCFDTSQIVTHSLNWKCVTFWHIIILGEWNIGRNKVTWLAGSIFVTWLVEGRLLLADQSTVGKLLSSCFEHFHLLSMIFGFERLSREIGLFDPFWYILIHLDLLMHFDPLNLIYFWIDKWIKSCDESTTSGAKSCEESTSSGSKIGVLKTGLVILNNFSLILNNLVFLFDQDNLLRIK